MFTWVMKDALQEEWNDDYVIIPSSQKEQSESHGNKLTVVMPTNIPRNRFGLYEIEMVIPFV
jgi:hypothetical protein